MAQSSHGWHGHAFQHAIAGLPGPGDGAGPGTGARTGDVGFDRVVEGFQSYPSGQPQFDEPQSSHQFLGPHNFSVYHPVHPVENFPANTYVGSNFPEQQQPTFYQNNNPRFLHGHGTPNIQPFTESQFNPRQHFDSGLRFENNFQDQVHTYIEQPSQPALAQQHWQSPVPVNFNNNSQLVYQQRHQVPSYPGAQSLPGDQGAEYYHPEGLDPQGAPGHQGHYMVQFQADQAGNHPKQFGEMATPTPNASHGEGNASSAGASTNGLQVAATPAPPMVTTQPQAWTKPLGLKYLEVKNAPTTKVITFKNLAPPDSNFDHSLPASPGPAGLIRSRGYRLPCEVRFEYEEAKKKKLAGKIASLMDEHIIAVGSKVSKPGSQSTKSKPPPKRKSAKMGSRKNAGSSDSSDEEIDPIDLERERIRNHPRPGEEIASAVIKKITEKSIKKTIEPQLTENVKNNISQFGSYIIELSTEVKGLREKVKAAGSQSSPDVESLRTTLKTKYDIIRRSLEAATTFGDPHTLSQMGVHKKLTANLCVLLQTQFIPPVNDCNGPLSKAILKLLSLVVNADSETLIQKCKLDRLQQKFKGEMDEETAGYMDKIFENAKKRSEEEQMKTMEAEKTESETKKPDTGASKKNLTGAKDSPPVSKASLARKETLQKDILQKKATAEIKKMQPTDYSGLGSARKRANPLPAPPKRSRDDDLDTRASKKTAVEDATGAPSATPTTNATVTSTATSATTPTASQTSLTADMQARSRPSGSMLPGRPRAQPKATPKRSAPELEPTFIGTLLGGIGGSKSEPKPRQPPARSEEPTRPPETPEQAARRERKESRRHLRVSWKPGDELTEVRIFEHDTEEDKGRDHNMLLDARDNRSEGQMLKQRRRDSDEDYEENLPKEIILQEWKELSPCNVAHIPEEKVEMNFETRGGKRSVESDQKKVMDEYEQRELMAIYTSFSEVPATPRSPTTRNQEVGQPKIHVLPSGPTKWQESLPPHNTKTAEIHHRWYDFIGRGSQVALKAAKLRLDAKYNPQPEQLQQPHRSSQQSQQPQQLHSGYQANMSRPRTQQETEQDVLNLLQSNKVKNYVDSDPYDPANPKTQRRHDYADPKVQRDADALEDVFAKFKGKPFPATEPPEHIRSSPQRVAEWHEGFNRDVQAKADRQHPPQQVHSQSYQQQSAQPVQYLHPQYQQAHYQQAQYGQAQGQPQQQVQGLDIAAILQRIQNNNNPATAQLHAQPIAQPTPERIAHPHQGAAVSPEDAQKARNAEVIMQALAYAKEQGIGNASASAPVPALAPNTTQPAPNPSLHDILNQLGATSSNQTLATPSQPLDFSQWGGSWPQPQTNQGYGGYGYNTQSQAFGVQAQSTLSQGNTDSQIPFGSQAQSSQSQKDMQTRNQQHQRENNDRGNRKGYHRGNKDRKGGNRSLYGTVPCKFWASGECRKGDECTYRHDPNDLK
ncbi:uncharacterized protein F4822DRAFT_424837 [Hypoxylon trugodes]|uniref:uncharacterized protein n=1 Tax=Hypoxylon trugodes TaxID=326681 RepID=UPI00219D6C6C|nr:uncharacterized protein F4822DRAFT_424837 [Hypoxylon trugodes]KAI1394358.1 hypothetical protein F4822DRAFT_424837 [Hypoxylon trugodes]